MKYKAVIFDLFGTLIDMFPLAEYHSTLSEMASILAVSSEDFTRLWLETVNERFTGAFPTLESNIEHICQVIGMPLEDSHITEAVRIRCQFTRRMFKPRPDTIETLIQFKEVGCKIGLVSDCSSEVPDLWPNTPFISLVDAPIFSCAVGFTKPDPRIYRLVCKRLAVVPRDCLYIGDGGSNELTGASQMGMHTVLIRAPYQDGYDFYRPDAKRWQGPVISRLKEALAFVG